MKTSQSRAGVSSGFLAVLGALTLLGSAVVGFRDHRGIESRVVRAVVNHHLAQMSPSRWFLDEAPATPNAEFRRLIAQKRQDLICAMDKWCPTNELGTAVREWVPQWGWGMVAKSSGVKDQPFALKVIGGAELFMLVPSKLASVVSDPFFCNRSDANGKFVTMRAYDMPGQILAAFALHEVGHGHHFWRVRQVADVVCDEVEMHLFTTDILDSYSNGEYRATIRRVLSRTEALGANGFKQALARVSASDLQELDKVVGATAIGQDVARVLVVQHLLTIGFEAVSRTGGGTDAQRQVYLWVTGLYSKSKPRS